MRANAITYVGHFFITGIYVMHAHYFAVIGGKFVNYIGQSDGLGGTLVMATDRNICSNKYNFPACYSMKKNAFLN